MNDSSIARTIQLNRSELGHKPLSATVTDAYAAMPIRIWSGDPDDDTGVWLRWSEWDEIRDHIEYCATMKLNPDDADYVVCNMDRSPHPAPLPCALERGHCTPDGVTTDHVDRSGRAW